MLGYLITGLILGLICGAITAWIYKKNWNTTFKFIDVGSEESAKSLSVVILIIVAVLMLILWKLMIFLWLLIIAAFFIYKKIIE